MVTIPDLAPRAGSFFFPQAFYCYNLINYYVIQHSQLHHDRRQRYENRNRFLVRRSGASVDGSDSFKKLTTAEHPMSVFLQLVPELKTSKSRMHLDLTTADVENEISRITKLGAKVIKPPAKDGFRFAVFQDPFGNEFCLLPA